MKAKEDSLFTLHCLPGFLGQSRDWDSILPMRINRYCYDFFSHRGTPPSFDLFDLGEWINTRAAGMPNPRVLMGYSFGGRVALHALIQNSKLWTAGIIVSAHLGLQNSMERQSRRLSDLAWAERFLKDDWGSLRDDWNSQPLFRFASVQAEKCEFEYSRFALSHALQAGSLANQKDLRAELSLLELPLLWISGEQDARFEKLMREAVALNPRFQGRCVSGAGHRVPWDQSDAFRQILFDFLQSLVGI